MSDTPDHISPQKFMAELMRYRKGSVSRRHFLGVTGLGMANIAAHERSLRDYARAKLAGLNWLTVQGDSATKGSIFSFTLDGAAHAHDISTVLDKRGVAVRAGSHCAMPLMAHLGVTATCRASFGLYNTTEEVDVLISALELCHDLFA